MTNFDLFALPQQLMTSLKKMKYETPTPVQAEVIPLALQGLDILATAQTGTGKTAAFGIPLVTKVLTTEKGSCLVLTPTRELAVQVINVLHQLLGFKTPIKTALLIGGEPMFKQFQQLKANPRIIVGTAGRIYDHLNRKSLTLKDTNLLILDEIDRMLDMGFGIQLDKILKYLTNQHQTLMFSATLPSEILKISEKYLVNPKRVTIGTVNKPVDEVHQEIIRVAESDKYEKLLGELDKRQGSIIVFVKTKYATERLAQKLLKQEHNVEAMHGDLRQRKRDKVIHAFRQKRYRIMVATDIAARGLDIAHVEHVINYDLPQCPEDYIHRIGRTGRAGAQGSALSFISPADNKKWKAINLLLDPQSSRTN
ncbi:MAG: DEAD/DEAH box helicase, partial [Alphaproteobacteria bacterium]|nr:DEAD/DEAH box helicase [Alphaproteobacteria bacterium]